MSDRPQKITFAKMRDMGVRGLLVYCADYRCSHSIAISGDLWRDDLRPSDIESRFVCTACGKRGADVRPDFNWNSVGAAPRAEFPVHLIMFRDQSRTGVELALDFER